MEGVENDLRTKMPLALTPISSYPDIEYADDTVIIAKVAEAATIALQALQERASRRGLFLNMEKTKEIAMNSDLKVRFLGGGTVPRVDHIKYLGVFISSDSGLSKEVGNRVGQAEQTFRKLSIIWRDKHLPLELKLRIYDACVKSKLLYALGTTWPHPTHLRRLESEH
eukprot:7075456-Alexandrium_andersonii.AAC.1